MCDTLDGIVTGAEQCDDNNSNPADGCNDCVLGYADVLIVGSTTRILGPTDPDLPGPMDENMATALGLTVRHSRRAAGAHTTPHSHD